MAYQIIHPWRKNPRLVFIEYSDDVSEDDVNGSFRDAILLMDQSLVPMHTIFDFTRMTSIPQNLLDLFQTSEIARHAQRGNWVIVKSNEFIGFVVNIVGQRLRFRFDYVDSPDAAWELFNAMGIC